MSKSEKIDWLLAIIVGLVFCFLFAHWCDAKAQSVTRKGNVFIQNSSSNKIKKDSLTLTGYFYMTSDGTKYPIYMSASGKCFIIRTSKSGKQYRQYLPEVTKQLNPNASGGKLSTAIVIKTYQNIKDYGKKIPDYRRQVDGVHGTDRANKE